MFGLEILDVVIGLMFVYLLLSLLATAINEYISAVMNRRGKELARGIGRLLEDLEGPDALRSAFKGLHSSTAVQSLTEQFYNHPLIRPLATRRGRLFGLLHDERACRRTSRRAHLRWRCWTCWATASPRPRSRSRPGIQGGLAGRHHEAAQA